MNFEFKIEEPVLHHTHIDNIRVKYLFIFMNVKFRITKHFEMSLAS